MKRYTVEHLTFRR